MFMDAKGTYLDSHGVDVNLLVQIIKEGNSLNNHRVHFVRGKFQFESIFLGMNILGKLGV